MAEGFKNYLRSQTNLSDEQIQVINDKAIHRKLRRNEFLLREGEICRHKVYVETGVLRTFGLTADGTEHILQFAPENSWTLDVESYDNRSPAKYNIGAAEPTQVLLWAKEDFEDLLSTIPQLKAFSQQLISHNIYTSRQRLLTLLSGTPEEKYDDFINSYPGLLLRLPLKMIAAYLGISLKTLNRVRHEQLVRS